MPDRITHKQVESACQRHNKALGFIAWNSPGRLQWADIKGDGMNRRNLYAVCNDTGGVTLSELKRRTMRATIAAIDLRIKFHKLPSYCVIIQAIHERGETQKAALYELNKRGLWLSDDQKQHAGLMGATNAIGID